MKTTLLAFAAALSIAAPTLAHDRRAEPLTIGTSHIVATHDEKRRINVVLPSDYEEEEAKYPLVIVLDGGTGQDLFLALGIARWNELWGRSEKAIVVGIETVDRQRELLPPTADAAEQERYPSAGEVETFRDWLIGEIVPMLRETYRHDGRAFLVGESAAGHFVAETWARQPGAFDGYAALSPSFQWDGQRLSREFEAMGAQERPPIFVSLADEGGATEEGALRFVSAAGPSLCFADRRESHVRHSNTLHQLLPEALQFLMPTEADWLEEFGFTVECEQNDGPSE